ncbi:hypothetical protein [Sulfurospirillum halorespirans]|uniref:Uncharacterized protein n=1 Tax=Sulfurospirillum halorespirans DSM 13726 TaxID=1193502 RepID=A0A1D7TGM9_9BACT|nr:hypothetical protein [Sulfurospirillum halorespirans]AOO64165.1 hypothetical protein SHALO_0368 [Sulfurospirillum halorespirans DSM 13726]
MPKAKKLSISKTSITSLKEQNYKKHFDTVDSSFAIEHYGTYLIYRHTGDSTNLHARVYLSLANHVDFIKALQKKGSSTIKPSSKINKQNVLDLFPQYSNFIIDSLLQIVPENSNVSTIRECLYACGIFLKAMQKNSISLEKLQDMTNEHQEIVWDTILDLKINRANKTHLTAFFNRVSELVPHFTSRRKAGRRIKKPTKALPTTTLYQLDICARKELNYIINRAKEYQQWMEEFQKINLFSLENLAKTYFDNVDLGNKGTSLNLIIKKIAMLLYNIDLRCWVRCVSPSVFRYKDGQQEEQHKKLLMIAQDGMNITINSEKIFAFWHKELITDWPFDRSIKECYKTLFVDEASFIASNFYKLGLKIADYTSRILPSMHEIYPLILYLLIRKGVNPEVLRSWKVHSDNNGEYQLGDNTGLTIDIHGIKSRNNTRYRTVIQHNSLTFEYLSFYLKWLTPLWERSNQNNFFLYLNFLEPKNNCVSIWTRRRFFDSIKRSNQSLYKKYLITDSMGEKLDSIDHMRLRVNKNYTNYLHGLTEYERQLKKGHKHINTQIHYENCAEFKEGKLYKIAKTQDKLVGIFSGKIIIDDDPKMFIFQGPLANCQNPKNPTFPNAPSLQSDEICSDWLKCLTQCSQSCVIPKIHGPVIFAWIKYMEEEKEIFLSEADWEKEYLIDYQAALNTIENFTTFEKEYALQEMRHYSTFVSKKFQRIRKLNLNEVEHDTTTY